MGTLGNKSKTGQTTPLETRIKQSISALALDHGAIKKKAWETRDRRYVCISPDGKRHRTSNLSRFCETHNISMTRLLEIASWHKGHPLPRKATWRGWSCYKVGTMKNNRRRIPK